MGEKLQDLLEVMKFVFLLVDGTVKSLENKKWDWLSDPLNFLPAAKALIPAIQGIENVPDAFEEMTSEDQETVKQYFKTEFDIPDDELEGIIEDTFVAALDIKYLVERWIDIVAKKEE